MDEEAVRMIPRLPNVNLKMLLFKRGISQRKLAQLTAISEVHISGIIRGWYNPTEDQLHRINEVIEKIEENHEVTASI